MAQIGTREIAVSWVLYSIREAIGLEIVRNAVLKSKLDGKFKNQVYYGKTFTQGNTFDDIYQLVYDFRKSGKRYLIFTSNGEIVQNRKKRKRSEFVESHYVSFIIRENTVTIIDPSRNNGKIGIYNPYIGLCLESFFKREGYMVEWLEMTSPCQVSHHDVFCQSWTLYLIYKRMKVSAMGQKVSAMGQKVYIPKNQNEKYEKILRFFKRLLHYNIFKTELRALYLENIKTHDNYKLLKTYDPCRLLLEMMTKDMYDEGEDDDKDDDKDRGEDRGEDRDVIDLT